MFRRRPVLARRRLRVARRRWLGCSAVLMMLAVVLALLLGIGVSVF